jgi:hypothetical protein
MKWLILAIAAEISVLLCLIYIFDGALHSWQSARLTWDHFAVAGIYTIVRVEFSRRRLSAEFRVRSAEQPVRALHS